MVDVTHDRHDGGPWLEQRRLVLFEEDLLGRLRGRLLPVALGTGDSRGRRLGDFMTELAGHE